MLPLPKGARAVLSNSDMYRIIAKNSLLCQILDNVIIERQQDFLSTLNYQFGFKAKSSTVLCTTMVNETIQYYTEKVAELSICCYLMLPKLLIKFHMKSYSNCYWQGMYALKLLNYCIICIHIKSVMSGGTINSLTPSLYSME